MPGDVTGIVTLPLTATPTGREYDHFCFPDEEAEAQRVKWFVHGKAATGWTEIWTQVSVAPNIDDLISIMDGAHLWWSFQWTFLKTFGDPSKISFHCIATIPGNRHWCLCFTFLFTMRNWDSVLSTRAWKWESGPELTIIESDLLVSWEGPSKSMGWITRSKERGMLHDKALGDLYATHG